MIRAIYMGGSVRLEIINRTREDIERLKLIDPKDVTKKNGAYYLRKPHKYMHIKPIFHAILDGERQLAFQMSETENT